MLVLSVFMKMLLLKRHLFSRLILCCFLAWCMFSSIDTFSFIQAQAIMLLAGNGSSVPPNATLPIAQVHRPIPRPCTADGYTRNKNFPTSSCSGLPSPISISSSSTNELTIGRPVGASVSSCSQAEATAVVSPLVHVSGTLGPAGIVSPLYAQFLKDDRIQIYLKDYQMSLLFILYIIVIVLAVAVPQARKASLARFLEKRKERLVVESLI